MPEFQKGQRVRVSYEAEYDIPSSVPNHHVLRLATGAYTRAPVEAIEAIAPPQPEEPTAWGSVVEVASVRLARVDEDGAPWRACGGAHIDGLYYHSWSGLTAKGPVKVLFDPDAGVATEAAKAERHPDLIDGEGDRWSWHKDHYSADDYPSIYKASREEINAAYGPVREAEPELPKTVVDGTGDTWYLKANGMYRLYEDHNLDGIYTLEEIRTLYGIKE